jgi:hypothetical protein
MINRYYSLQRRDPEAGEGVSWQIPLHVAFHVAWIAGIVCIRLQLIEIACCMLQGPRDMKKAPFGANFFRKSLI